MKNKRKYRVDELAEKAVVNTATDRPAYAQVRRKEKTWIAEVFLENSRLERKEETCSLHR